MMRFLVLYNGEVAPYSGAGGTVWQTNRALKELGHELELLTAADICRRISHHNAHYAFELPYRILEMVRARLARGAFDVLLISQPYGYRLGHWLRGERLRGRRTPVYLHRSHGHELVAHAQMTVLRSQLPIDLRPIWRQWSTEILELRLAWQSREALRVADGTIVPSEFDREFLIQHEAADATRVRTIHHASLNEYLAAPLAPYTLERHRRVLYVGNLTEIKGASVLPVAVAESFSHFADARLTVVAPAGDHSRLRAALAPSLLPRVTLLDWVDQAQLMGIYDNHGIQVIPSFYEGASKAHYEGMSRGLCLVCSVVGAMKDSIRDGINGLLVPPGDVQRLAMQLTRALADPAGAASMAAAARETARRYTWLRTAAEIVDFSQCRALDAAI
jgi:glycosyltransferase involved in cell wall biosynthesis